MTRFYGWIIVGVGILVTCVGIGAMVSLSVFLQPMSTAMGWSRTDISFAALLSFLFMGLGGFAWGALSDRFGARVVVACGGGLLGLGLVTASRAVTLGQFQALFGVLVGFATGSLYTPVMATTARWFTRHRSLAVALVTAGLGLGSSVAAPLAQWLIVQYDWRTAMFAMGCLTWVGIVPAALLLRNPPNAPKTASVEAARGSDRSGLTVAQALRTPQFAAISLTFFACCAAHSGPLFHLATYAIDRGVSSMAAATVLSAAGLASMCGKIACGLVADRVGAKNVVLGGLTLQAAALGLYLLTRELSQFYAVALIFGFAYGGVMPLYAILVRDYFGERIMGAVFGAAAFMSTLGMAIGPWAGGLLYDAFGGYPLMFIGSAGIGLVAVAIAFTFRPPRAFPRPLAAG